MKTSPSPTPKVTDKTKLTLKPVTEAKVKKTINNLDNIGDNCKEIFDNTQSINAAVAAIKGYNGAVNAGMKQLLYKKMTGKPKDISFFED
jgi:hypothetical protein